MLLACSGAAWPVTGVAGAAAAQHHAVERVAAAGRLDLFGSTLLEWRGIRRNAHPAIQADATGTLAYRGLIAAAGWWTSLELAGTADEPRPDLRAGAAGPTQASLWVQAGYRRGGLALTAGAIRDWFVRPAGDPATSEAFAAVRYQAGRWSGSLAYWESLSGVRGAYFEPAVAFHHIVNPFAGPAASWTSGLRGGFQLRERDPAAGVSVPGAVGTGLTHVIIDSRLRATIYLGSGLGLVAATGPELHFNRDPATRRDRDGAEAGVRFWWPVQAGLSWPLPRRE